MNRGDYIVESTLKSKYGTANIKKIAEGMYNVTIKGNHGDIIEEGNFSGTLEQVEIYVCKELNALAQPYIDGAEDEAKRMHEETDKLSDLIKRLQAIKHTYGDVPVTLFNEDGKHIEISTRDRYYRWNNFYEKVETYDIETGNEHYLDGYKIVHKGGKIVKLSAR